MKKFIVFLLIIVFSFVLLGCQQQPAISAELLSYATDTEPELSGFDMSDEKYSDALLSFSANIFSEQKKDDNILVSPLSLYIALGLLANGAKNDSLIQLENALGLSLEELNTYCYSLLDVLPDRKDAVVDINNSLWLNNSNPATVAENFLDTNALYYDMDVYRDNLSTAEGLKNVNLWIEKKTQGMIKNALEELDPMTVLLLINTLYFESIWASGKYDYFNYDFTDAKNKTSSNKFINGSSGGYYSSDSAEAVRISLKDGYYFLGILPNQNDIDGYIESFNKEEFRSLLSSNHNASVSWHLPAFTFDYEKTYNDILQDMGVLDIFSPSAADLTNLATMDGENIFVKEVLQKTKIELDNNGIKAAAVTVIVDESTSAPSEIKYIYFDRPFVFAIMDSQTDTPLFMGSLKYL